MNRKVVYNRCYGGFGLSPLAMKRYYSIKYPDVKLYFYKTEYQDDGKLKVTQVSSDDDSLKDLRSHSSEIRKKDFGDEFYIEYLSRDEEFYKNEYYVTYYDIERDDPALVQTVEELREDADGDFSDLDIADIGEEKYRIEEYDGWESVITQSTPYDWK